jgi:hypothetical protein
MRCDAFVAEVQPVKDDLVHGMTDGWVTRSPLEVGLRITQEVQCQQEELPPDLQLATGVIELLGDCFTLMPYSYELLLELVLRPVRVAQ